MSEDNQTTNQPEAGANAPAKKKSWPKREPGAKRTWQKKAAPATNSGGADGEKKDYKDLYAEATKRVVEALEKGTAPWQRPWDYKNILAPMNGTSQENYSGVNPVLLMIEAYDKGYTDPRWCTWKQAQDKGWGIKEEEKKKATTIYFYKPMPVEVKDENGQPVIDKETGEVKMKTIPMLKSYGVYNMAQLENPPPALEQPKGHEWDPVERAEKVIASMGVPILEGTNEAYYSPKADAITMPPKESFKTPNDYYATVLHELGHATGHSSRRNRDQTGRWATPEYSFEELIAEMTSMYTSMETDIYSEANVERHAAYVKSWIAALKNDKKLFFRATKEAELSADWIMDRDRTPVLDADKKPSPAKKAPAEPKAAAPKPVLGSTLRFTGEDGKAIEGILVDLRPGFGDTCQYQIKGADESITKVWSSKGKLDILATPEVPLQKPEKPKAEAKYTLYTASSFDDVKGVVHKAGFEVKQAVDGKWYFQQQGSAPSADAVLLTGQYKTEANAYYECGQTQGLDMESAKTAVGVRTPDGKRIKFDTAGALDKFVRETPDGLPSTVVEEVMHRFAEIAAAQPQTIPEAFKPHYYVQKSGEAMELVTPRGKQAVEGYEHLCHLLDTQQGFDSDVARLREDIEQTYWQNSDAGEYQTLTNQLFEERYGVSALDITDDERIAAEHSTGTHPALFVEIMASKYNLTPMLEVKNPYGLNAIQPGRDFTAAAPEAPKVMVPALDFGQVQNNQPGASSVGGMGM